MILLLVAIIICLLALVWFKDNGGMKCTSIRFSLWDSWKIFKFDELTLKAGINHYLTFEEKGNNEVELVVLKEIGRSSIIVEPQKQIKND